MRINSCAIPVRLNAWLLAIIVLATSIAPVHAARLALVVGNDQYQAIEKLKNAKNDANLMAGVLRKAGFDVTQAHDLSREALWSTVDAFKARVGKGDEVVFYFAGHGVQIGSAQLLLPTDIKTRTEAQVQRDGVALVDIQDALIDARIAVFIIDACRDNPFPKQGTRSVGATRGLLPPDPGTGQIIMLSAGRNQKALDEVPNQTVKNGLFTWELAQAIQTPGMEIRAVLEQVKASVDDKAKRAGHEQRPSLVNDLRGNFYFFLGPTTVQGAPASNTPTRARSAEEIEDTYWDSIKNSTDKTAFADYLKDYPGGRYAPLARRRAQELGSAAPQPSLTPVAPIKQAAGDMPPGKVFKDCADCPEMVVIPAGSFTMGSSAAEQALANAAGMPAAINNRESPQHGVKLRSFAAGRFAVTRGEFAAFVRASNYQAEAGQGDGCFFWTGIEWKKDKTLSWRSPGFPQEDDHPVVCVSWNDAMAYAQWVSRTSGKAYRLLSEAEREYATRAGTQTSFWWGDTINTRQANYAGTGKGYNGSPAGEWRKATVAVNRFATNPFGLYNLHGNVWEWVADCWHDTYNGAPGDGSAWTEACAGNQRVRRGGSWSGMPAMLRSAFRNRNFPDNRDIDIGFRLARTLHVP